MLVDLMELTTGQCQFARRFCLWEPGAPRIAAQLIRGRAHVVLCLFPLQGA